MSLLIHKYIPKTDDEFIFNTNIVKSIEYQKNTCNLNLFNVIIYGNYGSGKNSICYYLINSYFNNDNHIYNKKAIDFEINSNIISIVKSIYHYEIDVNDTKYTDKKIIIEFLLEICKTINLGNNTYKIIIIKNIELLNINIQMSLINIIDKYKETSKFFLLCNSIIKLKENLISRCLIINLKNPNDKEIKDILTNIIIKENINIKQNDISKIIKLSSNNITEAIFLLDYFQFSSKILINPSHESMNNLIKEFISNFNIDKVRNYIYDLLVNDISYDTFFIFFIKNIDTFISLKVEQKKNIMEGISYYSYLINKGYRTIFHFETAIIFIQNIIQEKKITLKKDFF
jgi:DNA polymerase III delta prime subunit